MAQEKPGFDYDKMLKESMEETKMPPVINRKASAEEDEIFLYSLAKMHGTRPEKIDVEVDGYWKYYKIDGAQIFRDRA